MREDSFARAAYVLAGEALQAGMLEVVLAFSKRLDKVVIVPDGPLPARHGSPDHREVFAVRYLQ
jgi:hypothetical protein